MVEARGDPHLFANVVEALFSDQRAVGNFQGYGDALDGVKRLVDDRKSAFRQPLAHAVFAESLSGPKHEAHILPVGPLCRSWASHPFVKKGPVRINKRLRT